MEPRDKLSPGTFKPSDRLAVERLLDQQELDAQPAARELRAARRLCGRWLMLRRLRRGLSLADISLRVGIAVELLQLIELGLAESPLADAEAWRRLSLVLEGAERDFQRVAAVLELALGQAELPAPAWIDALGVDLAHALQATEDGAADPQLLQDADRLVQQASKGKLPRHNVLVLQVLHQAFDQPLTSGEIKLRVEELGFSFNLADLPELLGKLQVAQLVAHVGGQIAGYRITPGGRKAFVLALSGSATQRQLHDVLGGLLNPL